MNTDKDTTQELTEGEHIKGMVEGRGWQIVEGRLKECILDLQNINNIDTTTPDAMAVDIKARKMAADILYQFLKNDVYGRIEQHETSKDALTDRHTDTFINRG